MNNIRPNLELKSGVTVVVCCYNSSKVIVPTISALYKQKVPKNCGYEVILVDNNCTDSTIDLAKCSWKNSNHHLKILNEKKPGLIHARKTGVYHARFDTILFIDDDNMLQGEWISKLIQLYKEMPKVGIIGGYNEALIGGKKPEWFDIYQGVYACGPRDKHSCINPKKVFGAGLSFRTKVVFPVLFSDSRLFLTGRTKHVLSRGEDTEIVIRCRLNGWDFYYDNSLKLQHNLQASRINWKYVIEARKRGGYAGVILRIYQRLVKGKEPYSFPKFVFFLLKQWINFFLKFKMKIFRINDEGTEQSFDFYRLAGMSRGLYAYRKDYKKIRAYILDHSRGSNET